MSTLLEKTVTTLVSLLLVSIIANLLKQLFYRNPRLPPTVWHWIPLIGNTVGYGQDPYKFFFKCQEKVRACWIHPAYWQEAGPPISWGNLWA